MFDADSFLGTTVTDANSTKQTPMPEGEYIGICGKPKARQYPGKKDPSALFTSLDIPVEIDVRALDPRLADELGRDKATVRYSTMLDFTESGGLDMGKGKNVGLGRAREAAGLNTPGQPFSPAMFEGRPVKVLVKHRIDGDNIYDEAKALAPVV